MTSLFRKSGGALYHWRAWRYQKLWRDFTLPLSQWLESWNPPKAQLLLIGPSAGYTLPTAWLQSFAEIHAYDFDPLAHYFFKRRHGPLPVQFHRVNVFWQNNQLSAAPLKAILARAPEATVLFCNVLGQVLLEGQASPAQWKAFLADLHSQLGARHWASYHDLYTVEPLPYLYHSGLKAEAKDLQDGLKNINYSPISVVDHALCDAFNEDLPRQYFKWSLVPTSLHIIEAVHSY